MLDASSLEVKVSWDSIHEPDKAPERVHLVLHDVQDRSKKVRHPLEELKKKLSMPTNQQMKLFLVYVLTFKFIFKLWNTVSRSWIMCLQKLQIQFLNNLI